ncbi:MAG: micrococcal nuclease [Microgenomates group bacterium LiPW_31]|nr:MAG: micrococcal nuclease [Microgenomates group bacterium LiPW_31]
MVLVKIKKKRLVLATGCVLLLLGGFVLGRIGSGNKSPVQPTPTPSPTTETFKVTRVIDGDTIEIEGGERVRYIGIDTPETVDPRKPVQCFGIEASKKNKELVEGKNVRLEKDITDKDKYGRLLRYVYLGPSPPVGGSGQAIFINLELVKQGFAFSYTYPPDIKYQAEILAAEAEAREANRGLWAACPIVSPTVLPTEAPTSDCNIKGNINTSGEKIYHLPGCGSYSKTQIDESRGERWFCSEEEAQAAGWRKALNCP